MVSMGLLAGVRSYGVRLTAARVGLARHRAPRAAVYFTATAASRRPHTASSKDPTPLREAASSPPASQHLPRGTRLFSFMPQKHSDESTSSPSSPTASPSNPPPEASSASSISSASSSAFPPSASTTSFPGSSTIRATQSRDADTEKDPDEFRFTPPTQDHHEDSDKNYAAGSTSHPPNPFLSRPRTQPSEMMNMDPIGWKEKWGEMYEEELDEDLDEDLDEMLDEELDEKMGNGRSSTQAPAPRDTLDESAKPAETVPSTADNATMLDDDIIRLKKPSTMIYIVGGNPEATYLAHSLSILPYMPRVQMLLLSRKFAHNWVREGREVQVLRPGLKPTSKKLRAYLMKSPPSATRQLSKRPLKGRLTRFAPTGTYYKQPIIRNLIITQACAPSIIAVGRLKHRLDNNSTICLVQPGLGVVERLNELFFPDPLTRPRYILAHMTHTLGYTNRSLSVAELKVGRLMLTLYDPPGWRQTATEAVTAEAQRRAQKALPRTPRTPGPDPQSPVPIRPGDLHALDFINEFSTPVPNERLEDDAKIPFQGKNSPLGRSMAYCGLHLMYLMGITPTLHTDFYRYSTFLQHKLPDMITTSATETVATMLDLSLSGGLMNNPEARLMIGRLVTEMISVAVALPETKNDPKLHWFVASGRLKRRINHLLHQHYFHNKDKDGVRRIGDFGDGGHYDRHRGPFVSEGPCRMALRTSLGRRSDIQFLNGYFVRRGLEVGVACPWNEMAIHVVQAKRLANKSNTTKTVNEHSLASKDVRDAIVFVHQATQKRAAANDKELQPKHASAAGKFPWKDFVKDKDATARESTMDTTQTKEYSA